MLLQTIAGETNVHDHRTGPRKERRCSKIITRGYLFCSKKEKTRAELKKY